MSRSNPYKRKRREAKRTILFYCEGEDDKVFLEYLKSKFARDTGVSVTIKQNHGGSANDVLYNVTKQIPTDSTFCIYDTDTGVDQELKNKVMKQGIVCLENKPCLEALLLHILESKNCSEHQKCDKCKHEFENKHLSEVNRKDKRKYKKLFPKRLLQEKAKEIENLRIIIDAMSGK